MLARRLRPGPGVPREAVAADQRERLMAALVVLADERGYQSLRVEDLIALAGVARGAFYEQFRGRDDLLLATVTEIGELGLRDAATAYKRGGPAEVRLRAAIEGVIGFAVAQTAAARLWLVDAYGAGPAAIDTAEQGLDGIRALVAQALAELAGEATPDEAPALDGTDAAALSPDAIRALTGAVHRLIASRLRRRHEDELPSLGRPLAAWIASYRPPPTPLRRPRGHATPGTDARIAPRDQAERILLGVCDAIYDKGYTATTLADVAARASTSIRTFYAHYESKEEAFVDAVDLAQVQSYAAVLAASRRAPDWPQAVRAGLTALCNYFAGEPPLAEAVVVEVHAAGEQALRRHEESTAAIGRLLEPGYELAPDTPAIAAEAIGSAIDTLLYDAIRAGGGPKVRAIAPTATYLALFPFIGSTAACEVANDTGQPRRRG
ncbi:MAG TPA: TetR/AcrR family transcriptional regulator [Thermoleophilaceae bacterium]|nr:TetR/AcrR family transcriptional regulator [Thermoleophilaceae bacterium]